MANAPYACQWNHIIPSRGTSKRLFSSDQVSRRLWSSFDKAFTFSFLVSKMELSTSQTVPIWGSLPSLKYSLIAFAVHSDFAASAQCCVS